ncbi:nuclear transport factor 2 family protein [Paractinoplanes lichenicola]|uniref:Nuclear transport factor 2 family protein n=1 Tax=Paractinoplanes lichenicola TaxID=2802976 RepID=A0ABS1VWS1_9ACTN|nr:nuclear transport factor 2 family protein [Actinoplanes lichenicola]MBL7258932.1 nuclear transport factor 2 family protein [Actinoplanes lichenicola]
MTALDDRAELIELLGHYADIANLKDFTGRPGRVFTDPLALDFESVTGISPATVPLADYVEILRASFTPWAATHHAITSHVIKIDGDRATIHAHVRAEHWLPSESRSWLVVGFYDNEAVRTAGGWRLNLVKLTATHQENADLAGVAMGHVRWRGVRAGHRRSVFVDARPRSRRSGRFLAGQHRW